MVQALETHPLDQETGRRATFDQDCLQRHGRLFHHDRLVPWDGAFESLLQAGHLQQDGDAWHVTKEARPQAEALRKTYAAEGFGRLQVRCAQSPTYRRLARRLFGGDHCPFSLLDEAQLHHAIEALEIEPQHRVLDLGCGVGTVTEEVQKRTGAQITGIDLAGSAIEAARERTRTNPRLRFIEGDLDHLGTLLAAEGQHYDRVLAVDVLYFLTDPEETLRQLLPFLKPGARLGLFASDLAKDGKDPLPAKSTRLGTVLRKLGLPFTATDFRASEERIWRLQARLAEELLPAFEEEGPGDLGRMMLQEARRCLPWVEAGRVRRYCYRVSTRS